MKGGKVKKKKSKENNNESNMKSLETSSAIDLSDDMNSSGGVSKSRKFTDFIAIHPYVVISVTLSICIICLILWQTTVDKELTDTGGVFSASKEVEVRRAWALRRLKERESKKSIPQRSLTDQQIQLTLLIADSRGVGNNIYTPNGILKIYETLQQVRGVQDTYTYPRGVSITGFDDYCLLVYNETITPPQSLGCKPSFSIIDQVIFHDKPNYNRTDVLALTQSYIDEQIAKFSTQTWYQQGYDFFFAKDFANNASHITRAKINFGVPLNGFSYYAVDNEDEQMDVHEGWVKQYKDFFEADDPPNINVNYMELILSWWEVSQLIDRDFILVGVAGVVVFIIIGIRTNSIFLAICALINILMSYPVAMTIYHGVLQIRMDTRMNSLALFIILGIGADDVFVFYDAWKQSALLPSVSNNIYDRLSWVWNRAASAMLVTSFTTFFAFIMTAISPIPAISVFGIVSSLLVLGNYLMVISFFPACIVVWNMYFEHFKYPCQCCNEVNTVKSQRDSKLASPRAIMHGAQDKNSIRHQKEVDITKYRRVEKFFYSKYAPFIRQNRYYLIAFFAVWFILALVATSFLRPPDEEAGFLPNDTELKRAIDQQDAWFSASAEAAFFSQQIGFVWGLNPDDPLDRSGIDINDDANLGSLILDPNFLFDNATANYISQACDKIKVATLSDGSPLVNNQQVRCFIQDLQKWEAETYSYNQRNSVDFYSQLNITQRWQEFLRVTDSNGVLLYNKYAKDIGLNQAGDRIIWIKVLADSVLQTTFSRTQGRKYMAGFDNLMYELNRDAPSTTTAQRGFQASEAWERHVTREELVFATILSVSLAYCVAVVSLVIASQNFIIAGFASLSIAGVVLTLLAFYVVGGWGLGFMQSVIATLLVGLSVDYCVHLAHSYNVMLVEGRFYRARNAMLEMGVSITGGVMTSMTSSFFLLFTIIPFFQLFGGFILFTIITSYIWTFGFFCPLMMVAGPEKKPIGDVGYVVGLIVNYFKKK